MIKKIQIMTLLVCSLSLQSVTAEPIKEISVVRDIVILHKPVDPLITLVGGFVLIGIGMWMNHKNKV